MSEPEGKGPPSKGPDEKAVPPGHGTAPSVAGTITSPMFERPSRRDMLKRVGLMTGVLAGSAVLGRAVWDKGGFGAASSSAARQVRDYRLAPSGDQSLAQLAI